MAPTDTRPGFKLPWAAERSESDQVSEKQAAESPVVEDPTVAEKVETPKMIDAPAPETFAPSSARRPTKFMVDLSKAMQAAAETSRDETMARLSADAKTAIDEIRASSVEEAAAVRRRADEDVAAVRDWSKGEIARIREAAEGRIAARKTALDGEMEAYAAVVETRVERVSGTVAEFEAEMADFFERLLVEEDPTRIATMAETMPDPPDLAGVAASVAEPTVELFDPIPSVLPIGANDPRLLALAATPMAPEIEAAPETETETVSAPEVDASVETAEPNSPDFAAAEAEAATFSGELDDDDGLASLSEHDAHPTDRAATNGSGRAASGERETTRVVVLGLVSVASIATFKRSLGRVPGVSAIGVASGPDGEFVFTVSHDSSLALADAIGALPGFDAHVTAQSAGGLEVAAHDPDAGV